MAQADSVHSTPPTSTSARHSRRSILGAIATGTVASLAPTIAEPGAAVAAVAISTAAQAGAPSSDPIFAAIEAHSKAYATMQAAFAEHRKAHELADATVGPADLDTPSMVNRGENVQASCRWDIERAIPREQYPELYARYNGLLEERKAAHAAIVESLIGDEDEATEEFCHPEFMMLKAFEKTIPTTLPGLMAMIVYAGECFENNADAFTDRDCPLIENLAIAAKALIGRRA